jgi:hypothetical protein
MIGKKKISNVKYVQFVFASYYFTYYLDLIGASITKEFKDIYKMELQNFIKIKVLIPSSYFMAD